MLSAEWGTSLTNDDESSDNADLFQSVTTLPTELYLNPHDTNKSNKTGKTNKPSTPSSPPQIGNKNPLSESDTNVTNTSLNTYPAPIPFI